MNPWSTLFGQMHRKIKLFGSDDFSHKLGQDHHNEAWRCETDDMELREYKSGHRKEIGHQEFNLKRQNAF